MQCAAPVTRNHVNKPDDLMRQNAEHLSGNLLPDRRSCLTEVSPVVRLPYNMSCTFADAPQMPHACHRF